MKKNLGPVFRELREGKNISISEITGENCSVSQLSKFERGDSDISLGKFVSVLDQIAVTPSEFATAANDFRQPQFDKLLTDIQKYWIDRNELKLIKMIEEEGKYIKKEYMVTFHKLNKTLIKAMLSGLNSQYKLSKNEKMEVADYLLSIAEWGYYEILLFGNISYYLDYTLVAILTKEMIKKTDYYKEVPNNKRILVSTVINVYFKSIENTALYDASYFKKTISDLLTEETLVYERTVFMIANGLYLTKTGEEEEGKRMMKEAINIFKVLGCSGLESIYVEYYNEST